MALVFIDSWDHYSPSQLWRKWTEGGGNIVAGRTGNGIEGSSINLPGKTFNAEYTKMTMGVAYKTPAFANHIMQFKNVTNSVQVGLANVGDGRLKLTWSSNGVGNIEGPPSSWVMPALEWHYFEMQFEITAGAPPHALASARVNGVEILAWDATLTGAPAGMKFNHIHLVGPGGGYNAIFDDLYVTDGEYLGDVRIGVLYPNAAGDSATWTPSPAGNNWQQVEEHPADDDTSYVAAASVGLKDLYNIDDIDPAFTGVIKGVQALWCVKKSDEGAGAVKGVWKSGATEIVQAAGHNFLAPNGFYPSAANYLYDIQTERKSLFTAGDWTKAEITSLQLGITRTL